MLHEIRIDLRSGIRGVSNAHAEVPCTLYSFCAGSHCGSAWVPDTQKVHKYCAINKLIPNRTVNKTQAWLLVSFVLVSSAVGFANVLNNIAAFTLFRGGEFLAVLNKDHLDALGMLFVRLHSQGIVINELFWGLWLFPFGVLVYQSRFLPRILGVWLLIGGLAYVVLSFTGILLPQYSGKVFTYSQPAFFSELAIMLWFLIRGVNTKRLPTPAVV